MLEVGLRVVRGYDWKWKDQDGGEGHAGTVVEVGKPLALLQNTTTHGQNSTDKTPDKTVIVQWDHGPRSNYRIGYQGYYDLLVFDNAAAGIQHNQIVCDGCKKFIVGFRWECSQCSNYDLCTHCYMADVHDVSHTFQRIQTPDSVGIDMSPREGCVKIPLKGIFIGAKVVRGPDWEWGNQDGGPGQSGTVIEIRGWDNESSRSVATVAWTLGTTNVYRLGYKGCVDLCSIEDATCGTYYKEHLPVLGHTFLTVGDSKSFIDLPNHTPVIYEVGDKVKVSKDIDTLKELQADHGGWNPRMGDYIDKIGFVHRITDRGDIRVQYEKCENRWTFHPLALVKIAGKETFSLGDWVQVKNDIVVVRNYQVNHGEWTDTMKSALGKTGKIVKIYRDGDLRVALDGHTWTLNPLNVIKIISLPVEEKPSSLPVEIGTTEVEIEKLLHYTSKGAAGISLIRECLKKYSGNIDVRLNDRVCGGKKTFLQVAAHEGSYELCVILLDAGASVNASDDEGDLPLHYAAFGNQPKIMELLLSRGAPVDAQNNTSCTALYVSVNRQHSACVKVLLRHRCNINLQDSYGDTALHDAIGKDAADIVDALITCDKIDFTIRNKRGFNVLHHAALKGNVHATRQLMLRVQNLANVKKDDGFGALHLASLNGHREVAEILITKSRGRININLQNNRLQVPLHVAVSQGQWSLVELLITHKADITAIDDDGDNVLHIAISKSCKKPSTIPTSESSHDAPKISQIWQELAATNKPKELALACYLVNCSNFGMLFLKTQNMKGKTPIDLAPSSQKEIFSEILFSYVRPELKQSPLRLQLSDSSVEQKNFTIETISNNEIEKSTSTSKNSEDELNTKAEEKNKDLERLKYLETRVADLEEASMCSICMERRRSVAFLCGHGACENCAAPLKTCHMCRKSITKKINLY